MLIAFNGSGNEVTNQDPSVKSCSTILYGSNPCKTSKKEGQI